jgi:hypothetical protein
MGARGDLPRHPREVAMFQRLSRSWSLVKASASVLRQDKELLVFPLVSLVSLVAVMAVFAVPTIALGMLEGFRGGTHALGAAHYALAFLFYFAQYFVIFFFNSALVGAAMMRLDGKDPTVSDGLRIATSRIGKIAGYALIAATVGLALRIIQERVGFVGKIVVAILGAGWSIATFLVVPVLVSRDIGPIDAVKESAALLRKTWGENLIGQAGIAAAFGLIFLLVIGAGVVLVFGAIATHSIAMIVVALVVTVLAVGITALVQAALSGIYEAALYRYAVDGSQTAGFDSGALKLAFAAK